MRFPVMPHFLVLLALGELVHRSAAADNVTLEASSSPPDGQNVVDAAFQSYSIEFNYMLDYAGNES